VLCPKCKTDRAHRSHRTGVKEYVASLAAYYPYRCRHCKHRFLQSRYGVPEVPSGQHQSTEREIRATRRAKNWERKKRHVTIYGIALLLFLVFLYLVTRDRGANNSPASASLRPPSHNIA
jgi:type II secretory ATPase GspE/PulE/Tfp pilus assembly ATPase PilB-like protein